SVHVAGLVENRVTTGTSPLRYIVGEGESHSLAPWTQHAAAERGWRSQPVNHTTAIKAQAMRIAAQGCAVQSAIGPKDHARAGCTAVGAAGELIKRIKGVSRTASDQLINGPEAGPAGAGRPVKIPSAINRKAGLGRIAIAAAREVVQHF